MSKKHRKNNRPKQLRPQIREIIADLDKHATKKGRGPIKIKGNKGETKVARGRCVHYTMMTKSGKAVPTISIRRDKDGNSYFYCYRCKKSWYPDLPDIEEVEHVFGKAEELNNRYKYLSVNLDVADGTKFTSIVGGYLARYKKFAKKTNEVIDKDAKKKRANKGKKRKGGGGDNGYAPANAGAWYSDGM